MKDAIINHWFETALVGSNVVVFVTDAQLRYVTVVNSLAMGDEEFFMRQNAA